MPLQLFINSPTPSLESPATSEDESMDPDAPILRTSSTGDNSHSESISRQTSSSSIESTQDIGMVAVGRSISMGSSQSSTASSTQPSNPVLGTNPDVDMRMEAISRMVKIRFITTIVFIFTKLDPSPPFPSKSLNCRTHACSVRPPHISAVQRSFSLAMRMLACASSCLLASIPNP